MKLPINYSYIFDAGEDRTVLTINDFQFFHTASEVFDLEIVAGDISSNTGNIEWEN